MALSRTVWLWYAYIENDDMNDLEFEGQGHVAQSSFWYRLLTLGIRHPKVKTARRYLTPFGCGTPTSKTAT